MSLPEFNEAGDLPEGVRQASLAEGLSRFGTGTPQRQAVTTHLLRIHELAVSTGGLARFLLFGSYITDKAEPNDVDVILVMRDDFVLTSCSPQALALYDHRRASDELGASIFWVRPAMLFLESL